MCVTFLCWYDCLPATRVQLVAGWLQGSGGWRTATHPTAARKQRGRAGDPLRGCPGHLLPAHAVRTSLQTNLLARAAPRFSHLPTAPPPNTGASGTSFRPGGKEGGLLASSPRQFWTRLGNGSSSPLAAPPAMRSSCLPAAPESGVGHRCTYWSRRVALHRCLKLSGLRALRCSTHFKDEGVTEDGGEVTCPGSWAGTT